MLMSPLVPDLLRAIELSVKTGNARFDEENKNFLGMQSRTIV